MLLQQLRPDGGNGIVRKIPFDSHVRQSHKVLFQLHWDGGSVKPVNYDK